VIYKLTRVKSTWEVVHVNVDPEMLDAFMEDPESWEDDMEVVGTLGECATDGNSYMMDTIEPLPPLEQLAAIKPSSVCASSEEPKYYDPGCKNPVEYEGDICESCKPHIEGLKLLLHPDFPWVRERLIELGCVEYIHASCDGVPDSGLSSAPGEVVYQDDLG
jgi:hypothetical protein